MPTSDVSAALRSRVRRRAAERCEYCLMPESAVSVSHQVDHIIALKTRRPHERREPRSMLRSLQQNTKEVTSPRLIR